jgi:S1-C subfamily serine protease
LPLLLLSAVPASLAAGGAPAAAAHDPSVDALEAVRADEARRIHVFARAAKAVVCVFSDDQRSGGGSGVIIDSEGYGLTNFHVVQPFVETRRGFGGLSDGKLYPLKLLGIDPGGDIAMFKLEGNDRFDYAPLGDSGVLRVGQWVAAMGDPFLLAQDYSPTVTLGIISGLHRYQKGQGNLLEYADCIQVSTSINPGNSGGPLFDLEGRVIGINGRASFEERGRVNVGLGYAVSINQIKRFMPGLRAGRLVEHGTLGATVREAGGDLLISAIQAFSAAEQAGVQLGDELLEVAGRRVRTANDYNNILATLPANWPVPLKLFRNGQTFEAAARLQRLALGTPMLYLVDLEHNHAELAKVLDGHASRTRTRLEQPFSRVVFEGWIRSADEAGGQAVSLVVESYAETTADDSQTPLPADEMIDPAVRDEWHELALPLLARPEIDLRWELLAGDEVNGRIVNVIERRLDAQRRIRWKFDWQSRELLEVTIGDQEQPDAIAWSPGALVEYGQLRWPGKWTRTTQSGEACVVEIESATVAGVGLEEPTATDSQEVAE